MRADRSAFNYSNQQNTLTEIGSASYQRLKSEGGKVVRYSYRSVQRIRNSRSSRQRQRYTAPVVLDEDTAPLVVPVSLIDDGGKPVPVGSYGTVNNWAVWTDNL